MRSRANQLWLIVAVCLFLGAAQGVRAQSNGSNTQNSNQNNGQNGANGQNNQTPAPPPNGPQNGQVNNQVNNQTNGQAPGPDESTRVNPDGSIGVNSQNPSQYGPDQNSTENPNPGNVLPPGPPCAQQTSASQQATTCVATSNSQAGATQGATPQQQSQYPVPIPTQFQVSRLGSSEWLQPGVRSPVHLGPFYVGSADFVFLAASNLQGAQSLPGSTGDYSYLGIIRTNINFDHVFKDSRLTFQYLPEVTVVNDQVSSNFNNESLTYTFTRPLSSRWNFALADNFNSVDGRILYGNFSLDVNSVSGNGVQNPFLAANERWISDTATSTFTYILSARDQFNFAPYFQFEHSNFSNFPTTGYNYGGSINWTHMLSPTKSFGLYADFNQRVYSSQFSNSLYSGFGGSFSDRLSPTLVFMISAAASTGLGGKSGTSGLTATGDVSLHKVFRTSSVAIEYYRGITTGPFLINGYTSRGDGAYEKRLGQWWRGSAGVAYESDSYTGGQVSGLYGTAQLSYRISRNFSWYAAYARRWQLEAPANFNVGNINFISSGLTWNLSQDYASISPTF
jgi:hypothetical protein